MEYCVQWLEIMALLRTDGKKISLKNEGDEAVWVEFCWAVLLQVGW